jgi:hypothetical protein
MTKDAQIAAFEALGKHPRLSDLVALAKPVIFAMADARRAEWPKDGDVRTRAEEAKLGADDAKTDHGDAIAVLERGPEDDAERNLACALLAHVLAESPPKEREAEDRIAGDVLWLATSTPFDATLLIDRALGDHASDLWDGIADRVRRIDAHKLSAGLGRGEALVGCAALALSSSVAAEKHAVSLSRDLKDPALLRVVTPALAAKPTTETRLDGEMAMAPRGPIATTALALSGVLFLLHAARIMAKLALAYKNPARVTLSRESVRIESHIELLGRTLRQRNVVIGREGLARAAREVRYPRAAFYAGLLALAVGSYLGVSTFVDGARSASPSLLLTGLLIVGAGIALDFMLGSIRPGAQALCRIVFVPKKGPAICVGAVDIERADLALASIVAPR